MGFSFRRFPDLDFTIVILEGVIPAEEIVEVARQLDLAGVTHWLNYVRPEADLSQLDLLSMTEAKRLIGEKLKTQLQGRQIRSAFVCDSPASEPIVRVWTGYVGRDEDYPSIPVLCSSLEAAYDYLGLSPEAREAADDAIGRSPPLHEHPEAQHPWSPPA